LSHREIPTSPIDPAHVPAKWSRFAAKTMRHSMKAAGPSGRAVEASLSVGWQAHNRRLAAIDIVIETQLPAQASSNRMAEATMSILRPIKKICLAGGVCNPVHLD